jgi:2-oxo-4-hydroxy-4-carboxy-5-ureidoimidazoline decarboxylase
MSNAIARINALQRDAFVTLLGGIYEHSPWVAEAAFAERPFADVAALSAALRRAMRAAGKERQLGLICAHPELAGKAAIRRELTPASTSEQAGAGLDRLEPEQYERLLRLNSAYRERFGFPFILAVRGYTATSVIAALERRLERDRVQEFETALAEIERIADFRLAELART